MNKLKLCIIGCRGHIEYVLSDLPTLPEVDVVAVSAGEKDFSMDRVVQSCQDAGHNPKLVDDYSEMLANFKPDVVCVDGPFLQHAAMSMEAMKNGAHVFCEKPVAFSMAELDNLTQSVIEHNVKIGAMMGLRYDPAFYTAFQQCQAGAIGKIRMINAQKSYKLGKRAPFFHDRKTYGGTIPWVGSHAIDWVKWFSGESFKKVTALHSNTDNFKHGEMEMTSLCQFEMSNDVIASVNLDYYRPGSATSHGDDRVRVVGTEGIIEVIGSKVKLINCENDGNSYIKTSCDRTVFADFIYGLQEECECIISTEDVLEVTKASLLARESADTGQSIYF